MAVFLMLMLPLAARAAFIPPAPAIQGTSYVLMDYASGQILASKDPELQVPPASLTKLMTLYITFDELKTGHIQLDTKFLISKHAWLLGVNGGASRMFVTVGDRVSVEDLIQGVIVDSGNDAATALAEGIAGSVSSFVPLMNDYAKKLGMTHSHFINADGLPADFLQGGKSTGPLPQDVVSAQDLAVLARAIIHNFPKYYPYFAQKEFTYDKIRQYNRVNLLFTDPSVDGLKTGFTDAAGYCLLASAKRDGQRLIAVVMGTKSEAYRNVAVEQLLNYGFQFYNTHELMGPQQPAAKVRIYQGATEELPVGTAEPLYVALPRGEGKELKVGVKIDKPIVAPVKLDQTVGVATVTLNDKTLRTVPLVSLAAVQGGGLIHNLADQVRLWMGGNSNPSAAAP
ncbi:MAG TPA: D-alanyl-D-alanine carboxypeptidase family protein [Nevskiaceae bacterium]